MSISIRCIDADKIIDPGERNARLNEITSWLEEHVGTRWDDWDWDYRKMYGWVLIQNYRSEQALLFKLKFGV